MTVESSIFDTLKGLVGNRVFPDFAPFGTATPFIVYSQSGGQVIRPVANVVPDKKNGLFMINVWADTRAQAASIALSVEQAMIEATVFNARPLEAPTSINDPDLSRFGTSQSFTIWSSR